MQKITKEQYESLTDVQKREWKKICKEMEQQDLYDAVLEEYSKCCDSEVRDWFDLDSMKNLKKKLRVLKKINAGEEVGEDEYMEILEKAQSDDSDMVMALA